ncbi:MAG: TerB family tellurite resistance protein [Chitinophagaceae bacterium]|nr:TerB family tellurite resistance protein [Rubrivivax sp.]
MLRSLKDLFESLLAPAGSASGPASVQDAAHRLQLATAVLLVEVMRADSQIGDAERQSVLATLRNRFSLADDELERLVELAERSSRDATDFHGFTSALNEQLDHAQKVQVIEAMWAVAYADGDLAAHENHVLWRIADLLHLPHGAYISAKMRAKAAADL